MERIIWHLRRERQHHRKSPERNDIAARSACRGARRTVDGGDEEPNAPGNPPRYYVYFNLKRRAANLASYRAVAARRRRQCNASSGSRMRILMASKWPREMALSPRARGNGGEINILFFSSSCGNGCVCVSASILLGGSMASLYRELRGGAKRQAGNRGVTCIGIRALCGMAYAYRPSGRPARKPSAVEGVRRIRHRTCAACNASIERPGGAKWHQE